MAFKDNAVELEERVQWTTVLQKLLKVTSSSALQPLQLLVTVMVVVGKSLKKYQKQFAKPLKMQRKTLIEVPMVKNNSSLKVTSEFGGARKSC